MKKLLIIMLVLVIAGLAFADVVIGTGTSTGRYPLNDYFVYSRSQCIYLASEINVAAGGVITDLRWFRNDSGADPNAIGTTEIWLTETAATTVSTWQTEGTLVATISNIDLGAGNGWLNVDIADFTYSGTGNLMVTVRTQNAPYTSPHSYWRYTTTSTNLALLGNSDSDNPPTVSTSSSRPNIAFVGITSPTPPNATTLLSPANSGTGILPNATLNWNTASGATAYKLGFGTDAAASNILSSSNVGNVLTYDPVPNLSPGTTYYWQVVPLNTYGDATGCPIWSFTTAAAVAPTLSTPVNAATGLMNTGISFSWNNVGADTYRIKLGTTSGGTDVLNNVTVTSPYVFSDNLSWVSTYYWSITATFADASVYTSSEFSFTTKANPTISTFPMEVTFGTLSADWPVLNWSQLSGQYGTALVAGERWYQDDFANVTTPLNKAAKMNIWSTNYGWLVTPPIAIPASGYELKFDIALTDYAATVPPTAGEQADDKFIVLVDDNPLMSSPTILREWNNTGSPYVFDNVSNTGENHTIDLDAYVGTVYFAFYGESAVSGGDNDFFVDNVIVRETPAAPIFSVNPASWDFGPQVVNGTVTKQFTIANNGGGVLNLTSVVVSGTYYTLLAAPADLSLAGGESTTFTVQYAPAAIGTHTGNVAITDGRAVTNVPLSGSASLLVNMTTGSKNIAVGETWNFFDSGGPTGAYQNNENYTYTFYPPAGYRVTATFSSFATESGWDFLKAYDGPSATSTLLVNYSGTQAGFTLDPMSSLTFMFTSDGSSTDAGWAAQISLVELPTGPPEAVTLTYPADHATGIPEAGFNLTWTPAMTGGSPLSYTVYISENETALFDEGGFDTSNQFFNPVTEGGIDFQYDQLWYWAVKAINAQGEATVVDPFEFTIEPEPFVINTFPWAETFETHADNSLPIGWTRSRSGEVTTGGWIIGTDYSSTYWAIPAHSVYAATNDDETNDNSSMDVLTSPIIDLSAQTASYFQLSFDSFYNQQYAATVEISINGVDWTTLQTLSTNTAWTTIDVNLSAYKLTPFYLRFHYNDNGSWAYGWAIDNVKVDAVPDNDVAVLSYDVPIEVVPENTLVTPMATVQNNGILTQTFDVSCTIGTYTSTVTVTGLVFGQSQQVSFTPLTPALWSAENVVITTILATDTVPANNTLNGALICLDLNVSAVANNAQTDQFVQFNLANPGVLTPLPTGYTGTYFMSGADWMNGKWMGVEYDDDTLVTDNYYQINPTTGVYLPSLGEPGQALMGIAWDDTHSIMYGATGTTGQLCTLDPVNGLATVLGTMWYNLSGVPTNLPAIAGLMIDIAYDNTNNILYGIDLGNDCLWTINPTTYELTLIGYFGVNLNYAQDAAFDQVNGNLYLTGYSTFGGLYWIDTTYGGAYLVGELGTAAYELDGFAIPYGTLAAAPVVTMSGAGVLSWEAIQGAISYNVYSSSDPYGTFTFEANVIGTSYTNAAAAMKFYKVTAVGGRSTNNHQEIRYSQPMKKAATNMNGKHNYTGTVR